MNACGAASDARRPWTLCASRQGLSRWPSDSVAFATMLMSGTRHWRRLCRGRPDCSTGREETAIGAKKLQTPEMSNIGHLRSRFADACARGARIRGPKDDLLAHEHSLLNPT